MRGYNLYFNEVRINRNPISGNDLKYIYDKRYIYKKNNKTNSVEKIPTSQIKVKECVII